MLNISTMAIAIISVVRSEYFQALLILFGFVVLAKIFHIFVAQYIRKIADHTRTDLDNAILKIITKPFYFLLVFIGFYFALKSLSILEPYTLWIDRVSFITVLLFISILVARVLNLLIIKWLKVQKRFEKTPRLINRAISVIIYLITILMILDYLNITITPLVATLGLGGLAVGLALQNTLSNFFAGLHIISDRPINVGDYIELEDGKKGYIEDIGWRSTRIKTLPNTIIVIPNSKLAESIILNYSMPEQEMSIVLQCGVSYNSDLKKVEKITIDVAKKIQRTTTGAVQEFEPFIRYHTFGDSNINFSIILRVKAFVDQYLVTHEFIKALKERYDKEDIEISWPVRKIYYGEK